MNLLTKRPILEVNLFGIFTRRNIDLYWSAAAVAAATVVVKAAAAVGRRKMLDWKWYFWHDVLWGKGKGAFWACYLVTSAEWLSTERSSDVFFKLFF